MEILVIHPGALGDVILSLPALATLRKRFPSGRITFAGNLDHLVPVVTGHAQNIISIATLPLHHFYVDAPIPEPAIRFWKSFDLIVSWTGGGDIGFAERFRSVHPNVRVAAWRPVKGESRHVAQIFLDSLGFDNGEGLGVEPVSICLSPESRDQGRAWLLAHGWDGCDPVWALHPGAGSVTKRWPVSRFSTLAKRISFQKKARLLIIEGSAERGLAAEIVSSLPDGNMMVFDSMSLSLLSSVLSHCRLLVGNDSGVAHLAAALGVRTIVLFGPTSPRQWAPLGRHVTVMRDTRGCKGCETPGAGHTCLENLTVEEVLEALNIGAD